MLKLLDIAWNQLLVAAQACRMHSRHGLLCKTSRHAAVTAAALVCAHFQLPTIEPQPAALQGYEDCHLVEQNREGVLQVGLAVQQLLALSASLESPTKVCPLNEDLGQALPAVGTCWVQQHSFLRIVACLQAAKALKPWLVVQVSRPQHRCFTECTGHKARAIAQWPAQACLLCVVLLGTGSGPGD